MSEQCERTSEQRSKWPSALRVDFAVILPNVQHYTISSNFATIIQIDEENTASGAIATAAAATTTGISTTTAPMLMTEYMMMKMTVGIQSSPY